MNRQILINKLQNVNIKGKALDWIISYLTNRTQQVEIKYILNKIKLKARSNPNSSYQGICQGSILDPARFLIYFNYVPTTFLEDRRIIMFAVDTTILSPSPYVHNLDQVKEEILKIAKNSCNTFNLKKNKSKIININFKTNTEISTDNQQQSIETSSTTKYL